ncbi:MAG: organoarsenical effux MFS transporter ArsJ [Rhodobacteraceae bacterium]|nr:organoarsenical effux MFS transporter ArsJ [Paracoccaceae bacterium]
MLTDGALRMLILLHFHVLGYSPLQLAYLFLIYEVAGAIANLTAGWLAARLGLKLTLYAGLILQISSLIALTQLDAAWNISISVLFVMLIQGLSGIAKDFTKMSAKSAVKTLAPKGEDSLLNWVSFLTGSKNSVKGFGFFLGAILLSFFGFVSSLLIMAVALLAILIIIFLSMPDGLPKGSKSILFSEIFSKNNDVNYLSAARLFLFGARDVWFVVGVPIYLYSTVSSNFVSNNGFAFFLVGGFLATWIILYGIIQANTPKLLGLEGVNRSKILFILRLWLQRLIAATLLMAVYVLIIKQSNLLSSVTLIFGLLIFGAIFAMISSLHSYLILAFSEDKRVTLDVGFYYMANALGRFFGTLLSGLTYQFGGLSICLFTASLMLFTSLMLTRKLG